MSAARTRPRPTRLPTMPRRWRETIVAVARRRNVVVRDLIGPARFDFAIRARQEAMYALRALGLSYTLVGDLVGGRDHSTAHHNVRVHARRHGLPVPGAAR